MKDCEKCKNHTKCKLKIKDKTIKCPFVHPIQPKEYSKDYSDGYAKAIDELKNKICMHFADWQYSEDDKVIKDIIELASDSVDEIAEQMKAGGIDGKVSIHR